MIDRDDTVLKTYIFKNAWPLSVGAPPELASDGDNTIGEFECTWQYQNYSISGVNF
jgi:hypothetical protein